MRDLGGIDLVSGNRPGLESSSRSNTEQAHDSMTIGEAYERAVALQQAGRIAEAEGVCRQILQVQPGHPDVLHLLGICRLQSGDRVAAMRLIQATLSLRPDDALAHSTLGAVFLELNRSEEALASYDRAVTLKPEFADAHNNRGNVLRALGRLDEALASYDAALALKADLAAAHYNRGLALQGLNRPEEAVASYDKALALEPSYADAHHYRALALQGLNRLDEALASYDRALELKPDLAAAHFNRGNALKELGRPEEALASYDRAIGLWPEHAGAYINRGATLLELHRLEEALASFDKALDRDPDHIHACYNRAFTLYRLNRLDEAVAGYDHVLALEPTYALAWNNRAVALVLLGRWDEALIAFDRAIALNPDLPYALGYRLHAKMNVCNWDGLDVACGKLIEAIEDGKKATAPFPLLVIPSSPALQKKCAQTYIADRYPAAAIPGWRGERYTHSRIRIGYFSTDFHNHATAYLMAKLFERHDRSRFEILGFSFGPALDDAMRRRLAKAFDRFVDVRNQTDAEIAAAARAFEIDIAVDLKGFTQGFRTGIFARRPAPVQVNYLGYPGTMGASYIDYLIADPTLIPLEDTRHYTEKIADLPHTYQVNDSSRKISERSFGRLELGLPESGFVFCCFNSNYKITPDLFDIWMRLLRSVEGSVLWLLQGHPAATENLRKEARVRGVSPDRLIFAERMELEDHLARHRLADLFLDTLHCNAHTTASDALWAGLPVLTRLGGTFAGRVAASLLNAIGLPELIAYSNEEYEAAALGLATEPGRLATLKQKLARNRTTHPLFNTELFVKHIECAYTEMWKRHEMGLPPDHIHVDP